MPNLLPQRIRISIMLTPRPGTPTVDVVVRWNGAIVVRQQLTSATRVSWFIEADVGVDDLAIEAEPGAIGIGTLYDAGG